VWGALAWKDILSAGGGFERPRINRLVRKKRGKILSDYSSYGRGGAGEFDTIAGQE